MSDKKLDIPSNCPSPARIEKTDSSSSRQSGSPPNWEFESFIICEPSCREARTRRSSWDESDDASSPELERCVKPSRLYSSDEKKFKSVTAEINELKKRFFESVEKLKDDPDNRELENLREIMKSNDDRRHSPARMRRRTKSSSSSSPVLETKNSNSPENSKKLNGTEATFDEISSKILELDPKLYLNNFFTELKTKRISMMEYSEMTEEGPIYDAECIQTYNDSDANEDDEYFCKTSRKLSQILEVEEIKKDPQEHAKKLEDFSPLQTARSKKSEKILEHFQARKQPGNFRSVSFEHYRQLGKPSEGSLSERTHQMFGYQINDFISLSAKTINTQSSHWLDDNDTNTPFQFVCVTNTIGGNKNASRESTPINENYTSGNPTSRKSTDRSDRSQPARKSNRSSNPESPKFQINLGRDSARSLKIEDVTTPDSLRKETEANTQLESSESLRKSSSSDSKTEINLESLEYSSRSSKEQDMNHSKSNTSTHRTCRRKDRHRRSDSNDESETPKTTSANSKRSYADSHRSEFKKPEMNVKSNRSSKSDKTPRPASIDQEDTPRTGRIPELDLRLERPDSQKASCRSAKIELDDVTKDSVRSEIKQKTQTSSRSFSPRSRNTMSRKSTPRGITPMTSSSRRSKDNLEDHDNAENLRTLAWKELEKVCDTLSNRTSVSFDSRKSSWKEPETLIQRETSSPEAIGWDKYSDPERTRSKKSSRKSVDSLNVESLGSPPVSVSRPKSSDITEKQDTESVDENNTEVLVSEDAEQTQQTQRSEKRLSTINEASFEDLETSTVFMEDLEKSKEAETTPRTTPRIISLKEKPMNESIPQPDDGRWNDLIKKFNQSPRNPDHRENPAFRWNAFEQSECDENSDERTRLIGNQYDPVETKMKDLKNPDSEYQEPLLEIKIKEKEPRPLESPRNVYYMNVHEREPFRIGEFGDVACWGPGKSDTTDSEKPKDHGDGIQTTEVLIIPEKREKDAKTQRQLWTELKEDFRISNKPFPQDSGFPRGLETSKSDISVTRKPEDENEGRISPIYAFTNNKQKIIKKKLIEFENVRNLKEPSKSTSSSESLASDKEDSDNLEFDSERTPRLSRSLSNLDTRKNKESSNGLNTSETELFQKTSQSSTEDSTNLNIFSARNQKENMAVKSNNWLSVKGEKSHTQNNKNNKKRKGSLKESSREYLSSGKSVPKLKLRNSSCFQNFYKRFISVFCLTSHSSAATSK